MKTKTYIIVNAIIIVVLLGGLWITSRTPDQVKPAETKETTPPSKKQGVLIDGYKRNPIKQIPRAIPETIPSDEGLTQAEGNDSIELITDIPAGAKYAIIIETGRRPPVCKLLNADGDSIEWDFSMQILTAKETEKYSVQLLNYEIQRGEEFFVEQEELDSIPENDFCTITLAEIDDETDVSDPNNITVDSLTSSTTHFPALAAGTIVVQTAGEKAKKVYVKVVQKGLLNMTVTSSEDVCGYPVLTKDI